MKNLDVWASGDKEEVQDAVLNQIALKSATPGRAENILYILASLLVNTKSRVNVEISGFTDENLEVITLTLSARNI